MNSLVLVVLSGLLIMLLTILFVYVYKRHEQETIKKKLGTSRKKNFIKVFSFEEKIMQKIGIPKERWQLFSIGIKVILFLVAILSYKAVGWLGLVIVSCIAVNLYFNDKLAKLLRESNVESLDVTLDFITIFKAEVSSGSSVLIAMQKYIVQLESTRTWDKQFLNNYIDNPSIVKLYDKYDYAHLNMVMYIYNMAAYAEEKGYSDTIETTIENIRNNIIKKKRYYNQYVAKSSEIIRPITVSYYVGIPFMVLTVMDSTNGFWTTFVGLIAAIVMFAIFFGFRFSVFKMSKSTMEGIL